MLNVIKQAMKELPSLLKEPGWNTLDITYERPHVKRVWRQWNENRIYLHEIQPCTADEAFWHPHPWPSAIYIAKGKYIMGMGNGAYYYLNAERTAEPAGTLILGPGTYYEMMATDGWHYVRPLETVMSIMITGVPWKDRVLGSAWDTGNIPRKELDQYDKLNIMSYFDTHMKFLTLHGRM